MSIEGQLMTWSQRTNKLETICGILKSRGVPSSIEHPGYLHVETQKCGDGDGAYIAAGFDGAGEFQVQENLECGRDGLGYGTLPEDASALSMALLIEAAATRQDVGDMVSAAGFSVTGTGGGCEAYRRRIAGITFHITDREDPSLPDSLTGPCTVSAYSGDTLEFIDGATVEYRSVVEALANGRFDS